MINLIQYSKAIFRDEGTKVEIHKISHVVLCPFESTHLQLVFRIQPKVFMHNGTNTQVSSTQGIKRPPKVSKAPLKGVSVTPAPFLPHPQHVTPAPHVYAHVTHAPPVVSAYLPSPPRPGKEVLVKQ